METRNSFRSFVREVVDALESSDVEYLIGGSVAMWAWGQPRTTADIDLVIHLPLSSISQLSQELGKRSMLVPPEIILDILLKETGDLPINAIHQESGLKAEFFLVREDDAFRRSCMERRRLVDFGPPINSVYVHAPEDLMLNKIAYYMLSQQSKHVFDIASVIATTGNDVIDWQYFDGWLERLELTETWYEMKAQVDEMLGD